jgi:hypothetical protein
MNKLKLRLDDLSVESFDTVRAERSKGTVMGQELCSCGGTCAGQATCDYTCDDPTCPYTCDDNTCAATCDTCSPSCWDTCRPRICYGTTVP